MLLKNTSKIVFLDSYKNVFLVEVLLEKAFYLEETKFRRILGANNTLCMNKVLPLRMTNLHVSIPFTSALELFPIYIHFVPCRIHRNSTKALLSFTTWYVAPESTVHKE